MRCKDCEHMASKMVGHVSTVYWCKKSPTTKQYVAGRGFLYQHLGVYPWKNKPHPKCPLRGETK